MPNPRCCGFATDQKTRKLRPCKAFSLSYSTKCVVHSRINAILIQAVWRSYITRKRINRFKHLPNEVWKHVIKHYYDDRTIAANIINLYKSYFKIYFHKFNNKVYYKGYYDKQLQTLHSLILPQYANDNWVDHYSSFYSKFAPHITYTKSYIVINMD